MKNKKLKVKYEENVKNVLAEDGISHIELIGQNKFHTKFSDLQKFNRSDSWAKRIIYNETFAAHLICQKPNETNRTHFHKKDDEWWVVLQGKIKWWIEDEEIIFAKKGDVVFVPRGKQHKIKTVGNQSSFRLAISPPDIPHFHPEKDMAPDDF